MSHFHLIDGTAYDATAFGETDATTGEWKIKTSPSVTYGTNGFFILKDGNSVTDQSGNSNNFTVGGGTLTNTEDSPSNNWVTFNPLCNSGSGQVSYSRANTRGGTGGGASFLSMMPTRGKWFMEFNMNAAGAGQDNGIGFWSVDEAQRIAFYASGFSYATAIESNGTKWDFGTQTTSWFGGFGNGDISILMSPSKFWWGVNGSWLNSGDPTSGSTGTGAVSLITAWVEQYNAGDVLANFGNGYFGTTAVSSQEQTPQE